MYPRHLLECDSPNAGPTGALWFSRATCSRWDTLKYPKWQWHLNFTPKAEILLKVSLQVCNLLGELPAEFLFTV